MSSSVFIGAIFGWHYLYAMGDEHAECSRRYYGLLGVIYAYLYARYDTCDDL